MRKTLLTGFGPFLFVRSNPAERLVRHFMTAGATGHNLTCRVLPVSYASSADIVIEEIDRAAQSGEPFDTIMMLGLAAHRQHWSVERLGRNICSGTDAEGTQPVGSVIMADAPETLASSLPVERIRDALREAGLPAELSDSAGDYLCNYLLFRTLDHLRRAAKRGEPAVRAGFLHIPADAHTFDGAETGLKHFGFGSHQIAVIACLEALAEELPLFPVPGGAVDIRSEIVHR